MQNLPLLNEIYEKYSEHFEMAGDRSDELLVQILLQMVERERNHTQYYKLLACEKQRERRYENYQ